MEQADPFLDLQTAVIANSERMGDFMAWADELQVHFRSLSARVQALEQGVQVDDIEARLERLKRMSGSISDAEADGA
jgi:hypothetical protein